MARAEGPLQIAVEERLVGRTTFPPAEVPREKPVVLLSRAGSSFPSFWLPLIATSPPGAVRVVAIAAMRLDSAEQRIAGVALIGAAIERLAVGRRERALR